MKKLLLLAICMLFGMFVNAQNFRVGINGGATLIETADNNDVSIGVDVSYFFKVTEKWDLGLTSGLTHFFGSDRTTVDVFGDTHVDNTDAQYIPLAASARYKLSDKFELGTDLGGTFGNFTGFYFRPLIGYNLNDKFQLTTSYRGIFNQDTKTLATASLGLNFRF